jgi:hypothetical protein
MNDTLHFCTVEELQQMELAALAALWELVPTERQRRYKAVCDREVRHAGASGSDALEKVVAGELLTRYAETALIPIGARWARTPPVSRQRRETMPTWSRRRRSKRSASRSDRLLPFLRQAWPSWPSCSSSCPGSAGGRPRRRT